MTSLTAEHDDSLTPCAADESADSTRPFSAMIPNAFRTLHCNAVRTEHIGQTVTLCGWVNSARDHGGVIFIDLRDREGLTQVVFRPEENAELAAQSHTLRDEDVLQITGKVAARLTPDA